MAVRIRMKKLGRRHRPYFRICAMDARSPRDGKVIEELGTYDPMLPDTDRRVSLNAERIKYWLSVGAQPSDKVAVLIKKYAGRVAESTVVSAEAPAAATGVESPSAEDAAAESPAAEEPAALVEE